ncbi:MAG: oligoendopeptidase F [Phycisphaerales bacterium]|nr:MAG: oligoendopeptidase F [Phycisphaerales bacterium]
MNSCIVRARWRRGISAVLAAAPLLAAGVPGCDSSHRDASIEAESIATETATTAKETKKVPERSEIETKYLWNTEAIFASTQQWEAEYAALEADIAKLAEAKGTLSNDADTLYSVLDQRDKVEPRIDRVYVYASLLADQDTRDGTQQAMDTKARLLVDKYIEAMSWMQPELIAIPFETVETWMAENDKLALYRQYFDNLFRQKKHILSPREEELIAMGGEVFRTPYTAYNLLTNADIQFPAITDADGDTVELSDSAFYLFMRSPDRRTRKAAYEGIVGTYKNYRNAAAALLNGGVQSHIFNVKARGYDSCLAASLDRGNIPVEVYDMLVRTVNENLPLLHRYQQIRKRVLKLDDGVRAYDLFAPLITGQSIGVSYEEAIDEIGEALAPLGDEYLTPMKRGFDSRWVDVFPTRGKRSGAYSSGTFLTQPYILMNFHGGYEDMSTLAHEMGHSMHSFFSRGTQPYVYSNYDIFCAEVASTCNEILLQNRVLERTEDPKKQLYLISEFLEGVRGTVFRQTMFSEFEQQVHKMAEQGIPLTADNISETYGKIMRKYYGPAYTHDELVDNYWIRIPHFYYNFYVYKYATSYCAASAIARRIMNGESGAVDAYLTFLKAGSSKYPIDLLKAAGVDMTTPDPIRDGMKLFEKLLDRAEVLVEEIKQKDA